jgi:hypothetical protein
MNYRAPPDAKVLPDSTTRLQGQTLRLNLRQPVQLGGSQLPDAWTLDKTIQRPRQMHSQHLHDIVEVGRVARPMRIPEPSSVERMGQVILLRALVQHNLELYRHELAGILLNEYKTDAEIGDVPKFLTWKMVVPFRGREPAVPMKVAFDIDLDGEGVAGIVDLEGLSADLMGDLGYWRFDRAVG